MQTRLCYIFGIFLKRKTYRLGDSKDFGTTIVPSKVKLMSEKFFVVLEIMGHLVSDISVPSDWNSNFGDFEEVLFFRRGESTKQEILIKLFGLKKEPVLSSSPVPLQADPRLPKGHRIAASHPPAAPG